MSRTSNSKTKKREREREYECKISFHLIHKYILDTYKYFFKRITLNAHVLLTNQKENKKI